MNGIKRSLLNSVIVLSAYKFALRAPIELTKTNLVMV